MVEIRLLVLALVLYFPVSVFAETIVLKSGKTVEGKILEKTDKYIKIDFQDMPLIYWFDEIESVDGVKQNSSLAKEETLSQDNTLTPVDVKAAEEYFRRGDAYNRQGNPAQAIFNFTKAIEINPSYAEAYCARAGVYFYQHNDVQTISDYTKAIEINPNYAEAYYYRGVTYYYTKEYDKAWLDVRKAEALGFIINSEFLADLKKASGIYKSVNKKNNSDNEEANVYLSKGIASRRSGDNHAAIAFFTKAIEADQNFAEAYECRGISYGSSQINDQDKSLADFNKAIELDPNNKDFYFGRALAYYYKQDFDNTWNDVHKAETLGFIVNPGFLADLKKASGRDK
ncbi:MAG: tetratricopeptide repeat protein [Candidatus Omnitrophica bacterium]|nr:tetratricopeptide repeat protein [Candidatus Omnitrophota bacterium]